MITGGMAESAGASRTLSTPAAIVEAFRMYRNQRIVVVVPCHNEETQITRVVETMPTEVDHIVIVDDTSTDRTVAVVENLQKIHPRIVLIRHEVNQGVGGSIASGYKWARDNGADVAVVMAGDGQMDPVDFFPIVDPVVEGSADYTKANRLFTGEAYKIIPKARYFGNAVLSLLTKIASGYWHIADSQAGYTAINRAALEAIDWDSMYKRYGQPNDLLVRLNVFDFRVRDIHTKPVYGVGERSGIRIPKVIVPIAMMLLRMFLWRLKEKYIIRDFHPLIFFYVMGVGLASVSAAFCVRLALLWMQTGRVPELTFLVVMFSATLAFQSLFFAMWFDMERNKDLK